MKEEVENKVKSIVGLYNFYKQQMNTVQRVGILTLWIDVSIEREEYEVAAGLQKELDKIINGEEEFYVISPSDMIDLQKEEMEKKIKESLEKEPITEKKKKLKFVNYWGSGIFEVFRLRLRHFKLVIFNLGIELK